MENSKLDKPIYYYKSLDLRIARDIDLWVKFDDLPPLLISPMKPVSDDEYRVLSLFAYAENYKLKELEEKLKILYPKLS